MVILTALDLLYFCMKFRMSVSVSNKKKKKPTEILVDICAWKLPQERKVGQL